MISCFMRPQISNAFCVVFVLMCCSCWRLACFLCFLAGLLLVFCFFLLGPCFFCVFLQLKVASRNTWNSLTQSSLFISCDQSSAQLALIVYRTLMLGSCMLLLCCSQAHSSLCGNTSSESLFSHTAATAFFNKFFAWLFLAP